MIDDNPIRAYKRYEINTETFQAMGVEPPPKYVNRELNSQIGIRSQDSYFEGLRKKIREKGLERGSGGA